VLLSLAEQVLDLRFARFEPETLERLDQLVPRA
jgi:hypothetical protein